MVFMKVRSVQMDIVNDVQSNIDHAIEMATAKSLADIDIVLFPELFSTGYQMDIIHEIAHQKNDPIFDRFSQFASSNKVNVLLGSIAYLEDKNVYNRSFVFDKSGKIISNYSKIHLFTLMNEEKYLAPGQEVHVFEVDKTLVTSIICYDLRFPELTRQLYVKHQPKVIFVPMEWPAPRTNAFRTLLMARAVENQCFVVSCNRIGQELGNVFEGNSLACDPFGNILADSDDKEQIIDIDLDLSIVDKVRNHMSCFADRRPDIYSDI